MSRQRAASRVVEDLSLLISFIVVIVGLAASALTGFPFDNVTLTSAGEVLPETVRFMLRFVTGGSALLLACLLPTVVVLGRPVREDLAERGGR